MLLALLVLVAGLALLTFAADHFVAGAARIAFAYRLSPVVVGAVIIGFGTSTPELLVSAIATVQDSLDIAVGNIIGSNVANLSLVLGIAALVAPIAVSSPTLRREVPLSTGAVLLFAVVVQDRLGVLEGTILLVALIAATGVIVLGARDPADVLGPETEEFVHPSETPVVGREAVRTVLGLLGTLAGAQAVVWAAQSLAATFGLAEGFVGFTVVAVGTSLPELVTSIQAARRGETDLIVGNLLGSNLLNALAVGATAGFLGPDLLADPSLTGLPVILMALVAIAAATLMATGRTVSRREGAILLLVYLAALPLMPR
jgi:cation:H+ antiporter